MQVNVTRKQKSHFNEDTNYFLTKMLHMHSKSCSHSSHKKQILFDVNPTYSLHYKPKDKKLAEIILDTEKNIKMVAYDTLDVA